MEKKTPRIFPRSRSLSEEVSTILQRSLPSDKPEQPYVSQKPKLLQIDSTVPPEKAEAYLAENFGSVIIPDPSGNKWNDLLFIVHGENEPPTDESLKGFGTSVLQNAAKRRVKKFMVISGPYNPEPKRHRQAIPLLYKGVSSMMRRDNEQEPVFRGIVVPMAAKYVHYGRSSLMLFNIKAKAEAVSHRVKNVFSSGQSFPNDVSFTLGKAINTSDPKDTAVEEALKQLGLTDLVMIMRVKRHLKKILSKCDSLENPAYLRENDLDQVI